MFRYLRSRIGSSYEIKDYDQDVFVSYTKLATHGFPQKVSCFALSERSGLLAIGTKEGRLQIYFPNGSQISAEIEFPIISIYFIDTSKTIIFQYNNLKKEKNSSTNFFLGKIVNNRLELHNIFINELFANLGFYKNMVNEVTCCKVLDGNGNSALLLGTIIGDIYAFWTASNKNQNDLTIFIHFDNTALANVEELKLIQKRSINDICINPFNANKTVLLFDNSVIIIFDKLADKVLRKIVVTSSITSICNNDNFQSFFCSLYDGFYFNFNLNSENNEEFISKPKSYFEGNSFTQMSQIAISETEKSEQFVIFSGGVPEDIECQNPICLFSGDNSLILNFDSEIINFKIFEEKGIALALFVLCQDELVAIDLKDSLWRMFSLPNLYPIHSSPVTCVLAISDISEQIISLFEQISNQQRNFSKIFSSNKWPLERFEEENISLISEKKDYFLILTGHDNGNVCIWQANDLNFNLLLVCNTSKEFEGFQKTEENNELNNNNNLKFPPIRKAGIFDPYSDDHRLCIQKICFDSKSGTFAIGGQAGQLMVFETLWKRTAPGNQLLLIDMTANVESSEYLDSGQHKHSESAIQPRSLPINYENGFCLYNNIIAQIKPPVPVTAISWNFNMGVLAAGNEFGYAICSIRERKLLLVKTLISSLDVLQISNKDCALSRFKSVKKSIRQSFRRKKIPASEQQENGGLTQQHNRHRQEREITQRKRNPNALDGETPNSLIKVLTFENCILSPFNTNQVYLFVGTQGGSVFIHLIRSDACTNNERCQLIKEIRLRHHAPIVAIELFHQQSYSRLIVFSEEQIRSFIIPTLKPFVYKYKLTAIEGSRIKKATTVKITNKELLTQKPEKFLAVITNRGEVFFISPINTKLIYKVPFVQTNNTIGIYSSVITGKGQIFYLNSGGSEFVRYGSHLLS